jgi:DeoR family fructose operon transcriptional repressor
MHKTKRLTIIKEFLLEKKDVQISDIAKIIDVSESTIRRDIKDLAKVGFLKEEYGSVVLVEHNETDILLDERYSQNTWAKHKIAKKAAALITDDSFVYIDAGSTTFHITKYIEAKNVTVVTNGLNIASEMAVLGHKVYLLGGEVKGVTMAIVGEEAVYNLKHYNFDISFIGANGINEVGYSTPDIREGIVKKTAVKQSRTSYVVADSSKYDKVTSFIFADRDECVLITE